MVQRYCPRYLIWLFALWFGSLCSAQVIRIRVVNAENGRPLQKQQISVSLLYDKQKKSSTKNDNLLQLETGTNGDVEFTLPQPAPTHLSVRATLTSEHWRCGCWALASTEDLIENGATGDPGREVTVSGILVRPRLGEILFVARPLTLLERLLYPLLKQ
jgi:hypothetical protein